MRRVVFVVAILVLMSSERGHGAEPRALNLVCNPGFERGVHGWKTVWDDNITAIGDQSPEAHTRSYSLLLTAEGANVGVDSKKIQADFDFDPDKRYVLSAWLCNLGIARGRFGVKFYCYDADGEHLQMKSTGRLTRDSVQGEWWQCRLPVGAGTEVDFPEHTDYVVIRLSYHVSIAFYRPGD